MPGQTPGNKKVVRDSELELSRRRHVWHVVLYGSSLTSTAPETNGTEVEYL